MGQMTSRRNQIKLEGARWCENPEKIVLVVPASVPDRMEGHHCCMLCVGTM